MAKKLLLFVHGLGGRGEDTWRRAGRRGFPELIREDKALSTAFDVAFYEYPTSLFSLPFSRSAPRIRDLAEGLQSQIDVRYDRYESIVLVCHSLGGLVARKYLLEEAKAGRELRAKKLLLYGVPNNGSAMASVGKFISWRHNQLIQLSKGSELIEELNSDWSTVDLTALDVRYVVALQDRLVDKASAVHMWGNVNVTVINAGHVSLVKPESSNDLAFLILRRFVLGRPPVFFSVGGGRSQAQEDFVQSVREYIRSQGLEPRTVEDYSEKDPRPLKDVSERMLECYGAVVVAFERTFIERGLERRGVLDRKKDLVDVKLPPLWNQIEGSMAFVLDLPLLVLAERGLVAEGVLESKYGYMVRWVDLAEESLRSSDFQADFNRWRAQVLTRRGDDPQAATVSGT